MPNAKTMNAGPHIRTRPHCAIPLAVADTVHTLVRDSPQSSRGYRRQLTSATIPPVRQKAVFICCFGLSATILVSRDWVY